MTTGNKPEEGLRDVEAGDNALNIFVVHRNDAFITKNTRLNLRAMIFKDPEKNLS